MFPEIEFSIYRFQFSSDQFFSYESYPGNIWRGAFGYALREVVCTNPGISCSACLMAGTCAHSVLFEEFPHPFELSPHDKKAVKPYIIHVPTDDNSNPLIKTVDILLIGRANDYYPYLIRAMFRAAEKGIDAARHVLAPHRVTQILPQGEARVLFEANKGIVARALRPQVPSFVNLPESFSIKLKTPVHLKSIKSNSDFDMQSWLISLIRRIANLGMYWQERLPETGLRIQEAKQIMPTKQSVRWESLSRFSSRQKQKVDLSGYIGEVHVDLDRHKALWPWIWIGQWFGVGKWTTIGLGQYEVVTS